MRQEAEFDSSGRFTVASQEKLRKLGDLARANAIRWVFFATQAAVAGKSRHCRLGVSQQSASVAWVVDSWPTWLEDPTPLIQLTEDYCPDFDYDCLRQALLWSLAQEPRFLSLMVESDQRSLVVEYTAEGVSQKELPADFGRVGVSFHLRFEPAILDRRFRRPEVRGAFHAEASYRLAFCPMSVNFEGQELSQGRIEAVLRGSRSKGFRERMQARVQSLLLEYPQGREPFLLGLVRHHLEDYLRSMKGSCPTHLLRPELRPGGGLALQSPQQVFAAQYEGADGGVWPGPAALTEVEVYSLLWSPAARLAGHPVQAQSSGLEVQLGPRLFLYLPPECLMTRNRWQRILCRRVLAQLGVSGNHLLLQQHGMLLDPLPLSRIPGEGWVYLVDAPDIEVELTGYQAIRRKPLEELMVEFQREVAEPGWGVKRGGPSRF